MEHSFWPHNECSCRLKAAEESFSAAAKAAVEILRALDDGDSDSPLFHTEFMAQQNKIYLEMLLVTNQVKAELATRGNEMPKACLRHYNDDVAKQDQKDQQEHIRGVLTHICRSFGLCESACLNLAEKLGY